VPVPDEEQRRRIEAICAAEEWVLDTAYGSWLDIPLARAELVVGLDFPRFVSLFRLTRRTIARSLDGRRSCTGNRESFRHALSRDSIMLWHFKSFRPKRRRIRGWEADRSGPEVLRLTSRDRLRTGSRDYPRSLAWTFPKAGPGGTRMTVSR
jgi:adenylate kinase family enzyme